MSTGRRTAQTAKISVVVPVYNEISLLEELRRRLAAALEPLAADFRVILVDDGSTDGTAELADKFHAEDARFCCVHLSRNFGHQAAVTAGLHYADGDVTCVMDGDLQDPPEVLSQLIAEWERGHEVVYAIRSDRKENWVLVKLYETFYRLLARISTVAMPVDAGDFCLMSGIVVEQVNRLPEKERFVRGLRTWVGFRQTGVRYERDARRGGDSKYSLMGLVQLAINGIVSFSDKPLLYVMVFGLLVSAGAFAYAGYLVLYAMFGYVVTGYASLMAGVLFMGGIQLTAMGIIGIYLSTVFKEVKARPTYIVGSLCGLGEPRPEVPRS
jgi:dolichol-phosphate mannosyltransferase